MSRENVKIFSQKFLFFLFSRFDEESVRLINSLKENNSRLWVILEIQFLFRFQFTPCIGDSCLYLGANLFFPGFLGGGDQNVFL